MQRLCVQLRHGSLMMVVVVISPLRSKPQFCSVQSGTAACQTSLSLHWDNLSLLPLLHHPLPCHTASGHRDEPSDVFSIGGCCNLQPAQLCKLRSHSSRSLCCSCGLPREPAQPPHSAFTRNSLTRRLEETNGKLDTPRAPCDLLHVVEEWVALSSVSYVAPLLQPRCLAARMMLAPSCDPPLALFLLLL